MTPSQRQSSVDDIAAVESSTPAEEYLFQVEDGVTRQRDTELQQAIAAALETGRQPQTQGNTAPATTRENNPPVEKAQENGNTTTADIQPGQKYRDEDGNLYTYQGTDEDGMARLTYEPSGEQILLRPKLLSDGTAGLSPVEETNPDSATEPNDPMGQEELSRYNAAIRNGDTYSTYGISREEFENPEKTTDEDLHEIIENWELTYRPGDERRYPYLYAKYLAAKDTLEQRRGTTARQEEQERQVTQEQQAIREQQAQQKPQEEQQNQQPSQESPAAQEPGVPVIANGRPAIVEQADGNGVSVRYQDENGNLSGPQRVDASQITPVTPADGSKTQTWPAASPEAANVPASSDSPTGQPLATPQQESTNAPASISIPIEKRGNRERAAYHLAPMETTLADLFDGTLDPTEIDGLVQSRLDEANTDLEKLQRKAPKIGADKAEYLEKKSQWQKSIQDAHDRIAYYKSLKDKIAEAQHSDIADAVRASEEFSPSNQDPLEPQDIYEYVASRLSGMKITPESFRSETGSGKSEQRTLAGLVASKEKGGVTIERAAELIFEDTEELRRYNFDGDTGDLRSIIIDVLHDGNPRSYMKRRAQERNLREREEQMSVPGRIAYERYGMTVDEAIAYEETFIPQEINRYRNFDENQYNGILADEYEQRKQEKRHGESEQQPSGEGFTDTTATSPGNGGSSDILSTQRPSDVTGIGEGTTREPRGETGDGMPVHGPEASLPAKSSGGLNSEQIKENTEPVMQNTTTGQVASDTDVASKPQPSQAESETSTENHSLAATALSSLERAGLGESDVAGELRRMAAEEAESSKPVGRGVFGNIYDQFKGKVKEAFAFLLRHKSGDLIGVFNRPDTGDISLVWGDKSGGLSHIIDKHVGNGKSFATIEEASDAIKDVIENGHKKSENGDKIVFQKENKLVTIRKNYREKGEKIADKNWILTAYDEKSADGGSAITTANETQAAPGTDISAGKGNTTDRNKQENGEKKSAQKKNDEKIEDFGEKIEGARKDMLSTLAKQMSQVDESALVAMPLGKAVNRPDFGKMQRDGMMTEAEARTAEALWQTVYASKKPAATRLNKAAIKAWARETAAKIRRLNEFLTGDADTRRRVIEEIGQMQYPNAESERKHFEKVKEWNPDITFDEPVFTPDEASVAAAVLAELGGGEHKISFKIEADGTHQYYRIKAANAGAVYGFRSTRDIDEAVRQVALLTRIAEGAADVVYPAECFRVVGRNPKMAPTGSYRVSWMTGRGYDIKQADFDSKEAAEAKATELKRKGIESRIAEIERVTGVYEEYRIQFTHPLTREYFDLDGSYPDKASAGQAMTDDLETLSEKIEARLNKNRPKTKSENYAIASGWDRQRGEMRYSVVYTGKDFSYFSGNHGIVKDFSTKAEAQAWLDANKENLESALDAEKKAQREFVYFEQSDNPRRGKDYRNGKDVTPERFTETFGLRGVQFGNWTNGADRQAALNETYDAFMDLAEVLGVSPRSLSLNGELGLAFGSRGGGRYSAHYETTEAVINLTKTRGAGSLAHEWWHALDNYLMRRSGSPLLYSTENHSAGGLRAEVHNAIVDMVRAVRASDYHKRSERQSNSVYWASIIEETARLFAEWVNMELQATGGMNHFLSRGIEPGTIERRKRQEYHRYMIICNIVEKEPIEFKEWEKEFAKKDNFPYPLPDEVAELGQKMRAIFNAIRERTNEDTGNIALFQQTSRSLPNDTPARRVATSAVMEALQQAGIPVEMATPEMVEEVLGRVNDPLTKIRKRTEQARLSAKRKTSLETALPEDESSFKGTVISSDDGAKVLKNLDKLAKDYEEKRLAAENVFVGEVAKALGMTDKGKSSQYSTFETKNGKVITIRLSNHNATVSNFDNNGETNGLSIVISRKPNKGVTNDGTSHVVEYFYPDKRLRNAEGKPLSEIVRSLEQALYSGEYQDKTGLADRQEVNGEDHIELMQTPVGKVYGWTVGGKIYLTESGLNPNTPVHEYTHLWAEAMRRKKPKGWAGIKDLLKGTPVWQEVLEDENYASIRDNEDEVASEALSRISGRENALKLEREAERILDSDSGMTEKVSSLALLGRMREALKRFWRWAGKNLFGIDRFRSIDEVTDRVLYDLVSGTDLRTGDLRESTDEVNERFNEQLAGLTEENADSVTLDLGRPSERLRAAGVEDKPMKLYGNKVIKKMKKHGFGIQELRDLPRAVANPIAVFNNYGKDGSRAILTELRTAQGNFLVTLDLGVDQDIDFNIVRSVFGKSDNSITDWINKGYATYINKEKALAFLSYQSAPIAATAANEELSSAANVIENFENPSIGGEKNVNGPESEEESIVKRAKEDGSYMKAPNGAPTRLNERQWVQVRTKAFKDWFGDWENDPENASKVVDENGEPLVVYHYTDNKFTIFGKDKNIGENTFRNASSPHYAATSTVGDWFTSRNDLPEYMGRPMKLFLNIKDPMEILSLSDLADSVSDYITDEDWESFENDYDDNYGIISAGEEFSNSVKEYGHDGIILKDEEFKGISYITFSPNQIKSSTDNVGRFDTGSDDIRFSIVSEAAASLSAEIETLGPDADKLKLLRRRMADFVGRHLTSEAGKEMYKSEIMKLIRQVSNARSVDEAEMYLRRLKTVMNSAELREATRGLEKLTHQRMTTKTDKGVRRGRLVDDRTRGLIEGIRETLGELMATGVDEELRGLRRELKSLKPEEGMSGEALAEQESRRASLKIEIRDLEERLDALRRGNLNETSRAVDEAIAELEDEFSERGYLGESKQARYERLLMKRRYIEVREGLSGLSETEARQKSAAAELTELRDRLKEEQTRGDEDAVSATLAEMARVRGLQEQLENEYLTLQEEAIEMTLELRDMVKDLYDTGRSAFLDRQRRRGERRLEIVRMGIRAVDTGKPGQKRKSLFYIGSAHRFPNRQHHCCYIGKQW